MQIWAHEQIKQLIFVQSQTQQCVFVFEHVNGLCRWSSTTDWNTEEGIGVMWDGQFGCDFTGVILRPFRSCAGVNVRIPR